jgi:hypothetical protein
MDLTILIKILIGVGLVLAGRRLFWLLIGGVGFVVGLGISSLFFHGSSAGMQLIVALTAAIAGALLAIYIQRSALWLVGFLAGGFLGVSLARMLVPDTLFITILAFLVCGSLGALLISKMFELALIILSSAIGAALITESILKETTIISIVLLVILFVLGIVIQSRKKKA